MANGKLAALKELESKAAHTRHEADRRTSAAAILKGKRNAASSLCEIVDEFRRQSYGYQEIAKTALFEVLNEMKHEILRLAELRLEASARALKIQADTLDAQLETVLPDVREAQA